MINTKTKNKSFINMWRYMQNLQLYNNDFMLRLDDEELVDIDLSSILYDDEVHDFPDERTTGRDYYYKKICNEIYNNIWFYFREIAINPSLEIRLLSKIGYKVDHMYEANQFILTPMRALILYLIDSELDYVIYGGMFDNSFGRHLLLYNIIRSYINNVAIDTNPNSPNNKFAKSINMKDYSTYLTNHDLVYKFILSDECYSSKRNRYDFIDIKDFILDKYLNKICLKKSKGNDKISTIHQFVYTDASFSYDLKALESDINMYNYMYAKDTIGYNTYLYDFINLHSNLNNAIIDIISKDPKWFKKNNKIITNITSIDEFMFNKTKYENALNNNGIRFYT
jgi:hypothetical protein